MVGRCREVRWPGELVYSFTFNIDRITATGFVFDLGSMDECPNLRDRNSSRRDANRSSCYIEDEWWTEVTFQTNSWFRRFQCSGTITRRKNRSRSLKCDVSSITSRVCLFATLCGAYPMRHPHVRCGDKRNGGTIQPKKKSVSARGRTPVPLVWNLIVRRSIEMKSFAKQRFRFDKLALKS